LSIFIHGVKNVNQNTIQNQNERIRVKLLDIVDVGGIKASVSKILFEQDWDRTAEILDKYETYDESIGKYSDLLEYFWEMCIHTAGEDIENNRVYVLAGLYNSETQSCTMDLFIFEIEDTKRDQ